MSLTINTNLSSLMVQLSLKKSTLDLNRALEQMTTGYRINSAKDDAAGYAVATKMNIDLSSYRVAQNNANLGLSLINTAESSLDIVTTHLQRIRDLAEQAANGTYGQDSIDALQMEIDQRTEEINRIMATTEYNGIKLFEGSGGGGTTVTVDETKRVVNQTTFQSGETYYLTTSDDLVKLQDLVNSGVDTTGVTFELMNDIDMSGVTFRGIGKDSSYLFCGDFKGNNHVISNLTINTTEDLVGLFGAVYGGSIDSLGLENCDISGGDYVGGLVGAIEDGTITSSYATGSVTGNNGVGGLVGSMGYGTITSSYATGSVTGNKYVGDLVGYLLGGSITSSYAMGSVTGDSNVGGLVGGLALGGSIVSSYATGSITGDSNVGGLVGINQSGTITSSYATGKVTGNTYVGGFTGGNYSTVSSGYFNTQTTGQTVGVANGDSSGVTGVSTAELNELIANGTLPQYDYENTYGGTNQGGGTGGGTQGTGSITLQVGIDSSENSRISFDTALSINLNVNVSTTTNARNALDDIDAVLDMVTAKQTEFGAVQNRLESVIDSLDVSIENTTSSLSIIKYADIAKVSSDFIRAQILQQASASLLATANQSPSVALGLI